MKTPTIGFFDGLVALDLVGPLEAFSNAFKTEAGGKQIGCYNTIVIGLGSRPFTSASGVVFKPDRTIKQVSSLDTVFIPGGPGLRQKPEITRQVSGWIARNAKRFRRIASVCTGIYGLAPTGLVDNRRVATHWGFTRDVARKFPRLKVDSDAIFTKDGPFYTSAGVTSGIDLALALIAEDFGPATALAVARELVVYLKRPGGQAQFSEPLKFQNDSKNGMADLAAWISTHLKADLSVAALADRAFLCPGISAGNSNGFLAVLQANLWRRRGWMRRAAACCPRRHPWRQFRIRPVLGAPIHFAGHLKEDLASVLHNTANALIPG